MLNTSKSEKVYSEYEDYLFKATGFIKPIIEKGDGCWVFDIDGNKYLDLNSGQFCVAFGHNNEELNKIVNDQMKKIHHTNTMVLTPEVLEAAKAMADINDENLCKTIFLSTGSEANECAIRYAKFINEKPLVLSLTKGYHGLTHALQSLTMNGIWSRPQLDSYQHIEAPDLLFNQYNIDDEAYIDKCLKQAKDLISANASKISAIILELILGVGGMIYLPQRYVKELREICRKNNVLFIVDECQTGFGRTGKWFAYQYYGIEPDIVVSAKMMGAGFPISAVTFNKNILKPIEGKITHFSSHQNDPLTTRIVTFVIDKIKKNNLLKSNNEKGSYLLQKLKHIASSSKILKNPRAVGLMAAFDLKPELVINSNRQITFDLMNSLMEKGVLIQAIRQGITFRIMPSFIITYEEIDYFINALISSLEELEKKY